MAYRPSVPAGEDVRIPPVPGGRRLSDLAGLDDRELLGMVAVSAGGQRNACCGV